MGADVQGAAVLMPHSSLAASVVLADESPQLPPAQRVQPAPQLPAQRVAQHGQGVSLGERAAAEVGPRCVSPASWEGCQRGC